MHDHPSTHRRSETSLSDLLSMVNHPYMATFCYNRRNRRNRSAFSKVVETMSPSYLSLKHLFLC